MPGFDAVADLPLSVENVAAERHEQETTGFTRVTTVLALHGADAVGRGEDVTYDPGDQDALQTYQAAGGLDDLAGEYTVAEFSAALEETILFPEPPESETSRHYRRWALESAGLDLALRQAETNLGSVLDRRYDPVRFVTSTGLGDPPSTDRVDAVRARWPDAEFKLDPNPAWDDALVDELRARDAVRVLDLKGLYEDDEVGTEVDAEFYRLLVEGFPEAVIEDPAVTPETRPILETAAGRLSWDYPITGVESIRELPIEPRWLNVKPSRFGTVESLFETLEWADRNGVTLYGGGQFELAVGRKQNQRLAALFYPDGPNDVAPSVFNQSTLPPELPRSPLPAPRGVRGL